LHLQPFIKGFTLPLTFYKPSAFSTQEIYHWRWSCFNQDSFMIKVYRGRLCHRSFGPPKTVPRLNCWRISQRRPVFQGPQKFVFYIQEAIRKPFTSCDSTLVVAWFDCIFVKSFSFFPPTHPRFSSFLCSLRTYVLCTHNWIYFCATHNWIYFWAPYALWCFDRIIGVVEANTMVWVPLSSY
jgi:hypothetical protein